ncbi:MAG: AraC family transcriptional regulator, partial [bacterium]|nr:AraC family transcriptional regulator [bacterium]
MNADRGSVSSDLLRILLQDLSLGQRTLRELLEVAGIDPALLQSSQQRLSADQFYVLWKAVEESADD